MSAPRLDATPLGRLLDSGVRHSEPARHAMSDQAQQPAAPPVVDLVQLARDQDEFARRAIGTTTTELLLASQVPAHIIVGALLANAALIICAATRNVVEARRHIDGAAKHLRWHKSIAPLLVSSAAGAIHAARESTARTQ